MMNIWTNSHHPY